MAKEMTGITREEQWERDGATHPVAFFTCGDDVIWGATARILKEFLTTVFGPPEGGAPPVGP